MRRGVVVLVVLTAVMVLSATPAMADRRRYDLKLWIGAGDGSAAYLPG